MRTYRGAWGVDGPIAYVQDGDDIHALGRDCLVAASVDWGVSTPGAALLARAILEDALTDQASVVALAQPFFELVAELPRSGFALAESEVRAWAKAHANQADGECEMIRRALAP